MSSDPDQHEAPSEPWAADGSAATVAAPDSLAERDALAQNPAPSEPWAADGSADTVAAPDSVAEPKRTTSAETFAFGGGDAEAPPPAALPLTQERPPTERFGRYELLGELGRGGMGVVFRARDPELDRLVALKVLPRGLQASAVQKERFLREARAAGKLDHPGIVRIYDMGSSGEALYFAMAMVEGEDLAARTARGPLPPKVAARIAHGVARALAHAHTHGLVHRDVKPGNILLEGGDEPRVTDFGLVVEVSAEAARMTHDGQVMGTPMYMPPEQARGEVQTAGPRWDVYALGAVLYEMLAGAPPYELGKPRSVLAAVLTEAPLPLRSRGVPVPADLVAVVERAMAREARDRYASMAAFADDLARYLRDEPVAARRISIARRTRLLLRRWRVPLAVAASVVLVAGAAVGGALILDQASTQRAQAAAEAEAASRLALVEERIAELVAKGEPERAERLFAEFAEIRSYEGTAALTEGWLRAAERALDRGDAVASAEAHVAAFSHAPTPALEGEALLGLAAGHARPPARWDLLGVTLDVLERRAPAAAETPDAWRMAMQAAAARRDLTGAADRAERAGLPDVAPVLRRLAQATHTPHHARGAQVVDLGGDGRPEVLALDGEEPLLHVLDGTDPALPELGIVSMAAFMTDDRNGALRHLLRGARFFAMADGSVGFAISDRGGRVSVARITGARDEPMVEVLASWQDDYPGAAAAADLDGDGREEIYVGIGTWSRRVWALRQRPDGRWDRYRPHPPSDLVNSELSALVPVDTDGDGRAELAGTMREWGGFDLRLWEASPGGPHPLRLAARRKIGFVTGVQAVKDPDASGELLVVSFGDQREAPQVFPPDRPRGAGDGLWVLRRRGAGFELVRDLSGSFLQTLYTGDVDGDERPDAIAWVADAAAKGFALHLDLAGDAPPPELPLQAATPEGFLDVDGDGQDELLVSILADSQAAHPADLWILGLGDDPLPLLHNRARVKRVPRLADGALAAGWARAEELVAAGWMGAAAERLDELADLAASPADAARLSRRAAELYREQGQHRVAAEHFEAAANHPPLAARATWAALDAREAATDFGEALSLADGLLARTDLSDKRRARIEARRAALIPLAAAMDRALVLDFTAPAPPPVEFLDPLSLRHRPGDGGLAIDAVGRRELLTVPVRWTDAVAAVELELSVADWEWASDLELVLRPAGAPDAAMQGLRLSKVGGSGRFAMTMQCHSTDSSTGTDLLPIDDDDELGRMLLRWTVAPEADTNDCSLLLAEASPEAVARASANQPSEAVPEGAQFLPRNFGLVDGAIGASQPRPADGRYELVLRANHAIPVGQMRFAGVVHALRARGLTLDAERLPARGAAEPAALLVSGEPRAARESLPSPSLARAVALLESGDRGGAQDEALRALRADRDDAAIRADTHWMLRQGEEAWDEALRARDPDGFALLVADTWRGAASMHPQRRAVHHALTQRLGDLEASPLADRADPELQETLGSVALWRAAAWVELGRTAAARRSLAFVDARAERMLTTAPDDATVHARAQRLQAGAAMGRARVALLDGRPKVAMAALLDGLDGSPTPELFADMVLADPLFGSLAEAEGWQRLEQTSAPHRAWGEASYP